MGQYYVIASLDQKEFIDPRAFGSGVKLMEFSMDGSSVMTGLAVLLASSNGQGGGDLHLPADSEWDDIPGRWTGQRIVVAGDYDEREGSPGKGVYQRCGTENPIEALANTLEPTGMFTSATTSSRSRARTRCGATTSRRCVVRRGRRPARMTMSPTALSEQHQPHVN
jgi:hypothetical protein